MLMIGAGRSSMLYCHTSRVHMNRSVEIKLPSVGHADGLYIAPYVHSPVLFLRVYTGSKGVHLAPHSALRKPSVENVLCAGV